MKKMFEFIFVRHTSATLQGYKAGSLFSYRPSRVEKFLRALETLDASLRRKGIRIHTIGVHASCRTATGCKRFHFGDVPLNNCELHFLKEL
jgi:hypothetical protein